MRDEPGFVELDGLPPCDSIISTASVLVVGRTGFVAYEAQGDDRLIDPPIALLRLTGLACLVAAGPNDEALHKHRFFRFGLQPYTLQELRRSPWLDEVSTGFRRAKRHVVFALKEETVDAAVEDVEFVGWHDSHADAMRAAQALALPQR